MTDILTREAGHIDTGNDFTAPDPWLRRLGSARHLKDFGGNKDFLRDLIALKYEVDPDDPDESDDAQLRFIYIAFDQTVIHAEAVIAPDTISSNALFQVNPREFDKDKARPSHFQFKPETRRRYTIVVKISTCLHCSLYFIRERSGSATIQGWQEAMRRLRCHDGTRR
ncbi:hypothetical protein DER46DRAFT_576426 [Fusarium sp. MPI-SDFR-AT-0072]|nr:hypothetical protein DER46DRAFT_576426 [Fusarium sp. MPI-SDFR-AT-0072]